MRVAKSKKEIARENIIRMTIKAKVTEIIIKIDQCKSLSFCDRIKAACA